MRISSDVVKAEPVFLVSLWMSSFPAGNEVYGKSIESSFPAWLKIRPLIKIVWWNWPLAFLSYVKLIALNCSGLTILSKYELHNQREVTLDLGLSSTETIFFLYLDHFSRRQALYSDIKVKDCHIRHQLQPHFTRDFCANIFCRKIQNLKNVGTKKLHTTLLYKKTAC